MFSNIQRICFATCIIFLATEPLNADVGKHRYFESQGEVVKAALDQAESTLWVRCFVRLRDGTVIFPRIFYYQGHKTLIGFRKVEKAGRLSQSSWMDGKAFLMLPKSEEIVAYYLLLRGATETNDIKFAPRTLFEVSAEELFSNESLAIPLIKDIKLTERQKSLNDELEIRYKKVYEDAMKRMSTPITSDTPRKWWEY